MKSSVSNHSERGAAHLILVIVFVVALIGVLGFLGYNAWQKQAANAGGESTLARGGHGADGEPLLECRTQVSASPLPNFRTSSTYEVKIKALRRDVKVKFVVNYTTHPQRVPYGALTKHGPLVNVSKGDTKTIRFTNATPHSINGEAVYRAEAYLKTNVDDGAWCWRPGFVVSPAN